MLKSVLAALLVVIGTGSPVFAGTTITPTTTLTAETSNNTSASDSYNATSNGNARPGNVSQVSIRKLLYAGATAKVYAHFMGWFGTNNHMNVGYDSATLPQVHKQITDMMNRGIDGVIIDWYGISNTHIDQASLYVKQDAETRGAKFTFAIMEDQGAVKSCAYQDGCDVTQKLIDDFNYIVATYGASPEYMRVDGRPLILTFDVENLPNIDWYKVMASVKGNPKIVLRNDQGFRFWYTSGSYSWVSINKQNPDDWAQQYLGDFYLTSRTYPTQMVYSGAWKGFNDSLAAWGQNRIMNQNCGQVWLSTFNEMNQYFSTHAEVSGAQLVTWNDYEEGTEIETGIDNCVSVSGSVVASTLYWSISGGQENTIDHYTVFISLDGENLMKVADVPAGTHQLDLSSYGFDPDNYTIYVKAVGQPAMLNKMSEGIPFSVVNVPFTITAITPQDGQTVGQRVHFVAQTQSQSKVTAMKIYVDNVAKYSVNGDSIDTVLPLAIGNRYVVLQGWNTDGEIAKTPLHLKVVNQPPVVSLSLSASHGFVPMVVTAAASGTDPDGTIAAYSIDFGDGTIVNTSTAVHTYSKLGQYTITATVTDNDGAQGTAKAQVSVVGFKTSPTRHLRASAIKAPTQNEMAPTAIASTSTVQTNSRSELTAAPVTVLTDVAPLPLFLNYVFPDNTAEDEQTDEPDPNSSVK